MPALLSRRRLLALLGLSAASLAGCQGTPQNDSPPTTATRSDTRTPRSTTRTSTLTQQQTQTREEMTAQTTEQAGEELPVVITDDQMHGPVYRIDRFPRRWTDSRTTGLAEQVQSQYDTRQKQVENLFIEVARMTEDEMEGTLAAQKVLWEFDWANQGTFHTDPITSFSGAAGETLEVAYIDQNGQAHLDGYKAHGDHTDQGDQYPDLAHSRYHDGGWIDSIPAAYETLIRDDRVSDPRDYGDTWTESMVEGVNDWIIGANSDLSANGGDFAYGWEVPVDPSDEYWRRLGRAMDAVQGTQVDSLEDVEYIRMKRDLTRAANTLTYGDVLRAEIQDGETQYLKADEKVLFDENFDPEAWE